MALLHVPRVGHITAKRLIRMFGSPKAVFEQDRASLSKELSPYLVDELLSYDPGNDRSIDEEFERIERFGARVLTIDDDDYPKNIIDLRDAPTLLYVKGEILRQDDLAVGIVGTRRASRYGIEQARRFAKYLARNGVTIVSGMAMGIDGNAQQSAIENGGRTIAVLGCGVDVIYPSMHRKLYEEIIQNGAIVSDFPMGTDSQPQNFPPRNRIISGLSKAVLVVEGRIKSGALITARYAADQGRDVFALPGDINRPTSRGPNSLIRDGAIPVLDPQEIAENLGIVSMPDNKRNVVTGLASKLDGVEKIIYKELGFEGKHIDAIAISTGYSIQQTLAVLTVLEMRDIVKRLPGMMFARNV